MPDPGRGCRHGPAAWRTRLVPSWWFSSPPASLLATTAAGVRTEICRLLAAGRLGRRGPVSISSRRRSPRAMEFDAPAALGGIAASRPIKTGLALRLVTALARQRNAPRASRKSRACPSPADPARDPALRHRPEPTMSAQAGHAPSARRTTGPVWPMPNHARPKTVRRTAARAREGCGVLMPGCDVGQVASRRSGQSSRARAAPALPLPSCGYGQEQRSAATATAWQPLSLNAAEQGPCLSECLLPGRVSGASSGTPEHCRRSQAWHSIVPRLRKCSIYAFDLCPRQDSNLRSRLRRGLPDMPLTCGNAPAGALPGRVPGTGLGRLLLAGCCVRARTRRVRRPSLAGGFGAGLLPAPRRPSNSGGWAL